MNGTVGTPTYCGSPSGRRPRSRLATIPKSGCSDLAVEVGSGTIGVLPVSSSIDPSLCDDIVWCSDRTTARRFAILACRGNSSQTSRPGTAVRIGRNGPRYSAGASGLGSQVSNWLGPPHIQNRKTVVSADGPAWARAASTSDRGRPPSASDPARRKVRRETGPGQVRGIRRRLAAGGGEASAAKEVYHRGGPGGTPAV